MTDNPAYETRIRLWASRLICPRTHAVMPRHPTDAMLKAAAKAMSPGALPTQEWVSVKTKHAIRYRAMVEKGESE